MIVPPPVDGLVRRPSPASWLPFRRWHLPSSSAPSAVTPCVGLKTGTRNHRSVATTEVGSRHGRHESSQSCRYQKEAICVMLILPLWYIVSVDECFDGITRLGCNPVALGRWLCEPRSIYALAYLNWALPRRWVSCVPNPHCTSQPPNLPPLLYDSCAPPPPLQQPNLTLIRQGFNSAPNYDVPNLQLVIKGPDQTPVAVASSSRWHVAFLMFMPMWWSHHCAKYWSQSGAGFMFVKTSAVVLSPPPAPRTHSIYFFFILLWQLNPAIA